ncbi:MAG: hypothetical protein ACJ0K4_01250 [Verrucomicrobiales bacterium]
MGSLILAGIPRPMMRWLHGFKTDGTVDYDERDWSHVGTVYVPIPLQREKEWARFRSRFRAVLLRCRLPSLITAKRRLRIRTRSPGRKNSMDREDVTS